MSDTKKQPELRFRHLDGEKWQEVRALEIDGRRASVREKWLDFTPSFLSLYAEWDPGMMVHKHGHNSDHVVYVIKGEMTCGDVVCKAGMHITLEKGAVFGPFVAGPEGCVLFEVMMGDPRSFPADRARAGAADAWIRWRAARLPGARAGGPGGPPRGIAEAASRSAS